MMRTDETPGVYLTGAATLFALHARGFTTETALRERRDRILKAFESGETVPTEELLHELAEINLKLGEGGGEHG